MYGSYPRIESGSCMDSFNDLLGAPCDYHDFTNFKNQFDKLWNILLDAYKLKFFLSTSSNKKTHDHAEFL